MSTEAVAEKVKFVPLYVHDGAKEKDNGGFTGSLSIITMPHYANGVKNIGDIHPYGGEGFPDYEEAKVYAKLFAAAPDLLEALQMFIDFPEEDIAEAIRKAKNAISKATL